ncbi:cold-inducible protein YdjO-related protein [Neobacillus mesonae]|uniref:cold-inducible protein YdjO-related protein n=1 Tax=Neobacillus mesonae TaxID=1193713 RepID=UPI00203ED3FF|nr:cold-inducible protein YdjO-related protein [Neobacillus mesonae]MCM3568890.1 cold-shock protein [Neobacillus mesonae]
METVLEDTEVFACIVDSCIGWMRKDFAADDLLCPMCGSEMMPEIRVLPKI